MAHTPDIINYSRGVTKELICIALMMAVLHDLVVKTTDILIAYVAAPNRERIRAILGPEFRDNTGMSAIIIRVLHSLKSADASFRPHLSLCLQEFGYDSCKADPDQQMKSETNVGITSLS